MSRRGLTLIGAVAAAVFFAARVAPWPALALCLKPIPVLVMALWVAQSDRRRYGRLIAFALALSAVADFVIELSAGFVPALGIFLVAHLIYLAAFLGETRRWALGALVVTCLYVFTVVPLLWPHLGGLRLPVAAYMTVMSLMLWRAGAGIGVAGRPQAARWAGAIGAASYAVADTVLAWDRFRAPVETADFVVISLYWLGQLGIAASAASGSGQSDDAR